MPQLLDLSRLTTSDALATSTLSATERIRTTLIFYDYAGQDPINESDPSGQCPVCVVVVVVGVAAVAEATYGAYESWRQGQLQKASSVPSSGPSSYKAVIVRERGVTVEIYTGDHGPPHAHVTGEGEETRVGQNGKPLAGDPELSRRQRQVVEENGAVIRKRIGRAMRDYRHHG